MAEIAKVNDVAWADIAEVGGVAKADIAKIGASADAPSSALANTHCADFGGGYLEAATWADFAFNGNVVGESISFSLWVYLSSTAGHQTLLSKFGGIDGYVLAVYNNELSFSIWDQPVNPPTYPNGCWFQTATAGTPLALDTGRWQHIVAIFDVVSVKPCLARIYIDGQDTNAVVNATYNQMAGNAFTYTKFRLGSRGAGTAGLVYSGKMDEVSIWSKALTAGEVAAIHTSGVVTTTADLTGLSGLESWYRFKSTDNFAGTAGGIVDELGNADLTSSPGGVSSATV